MGLLERFAAGDVDAFEVLFRQHQCEAFRWIMRMVRNRATAEDLTIEAFWRTYRAHAQFRPSAGNFPAWLRRIATNVALDHLRRSRMEVPLLDDPPGTAQPHLAERHELRRAISDGINRLSPKLRVVILLALVEEEPYEHIAESLGISVGVVKVRVFRGIRILRKELSEAGVRP